MVAYCALNLESKLAYQNAGGSGWNHSKVCFNCQGFYFCWLDLEYAESRLFHRLGFMCTCLRQATRYKIKKTLKLKRSSHRPALLFHQSQQTVMLIPCALVFPFNLVSFCLFDMFIKQRLQAAQIKSNSESPCYSHLPTF